MRRASAVPARLRRLGRFLREVWREILHDELLDIAGQLAYSSLLALFPFLIFLTTMLGFLPIHGVAERLLADLRAVLPAGALPVVEETVRGVVSDQKPWLLALSIAGSVWVASGGIGALTTGLNHCFDVRETRSWVHVRLRAIAITLGATILLIVIAVAFMIGPALVERAAAFLGLDRLVAIVWAWLRWPAAVVAMSVLLAVLYWACPNVDQPFRLFTVGSLFAVPAWIGVSLLFNLYVTHLGSFNKTYGALGTAVVLLIWIYLSALIVLIGGEMNAVLWKSRASPAPSSSPRRPTLAPA